MTELTKNCAKPLLQPSLDTMESNDDERTTLTSNVNHDHHPLDYLKSETMTSLQQVRRFRLQKSADIRKTAHSMDDIRCRSKDSQRRTVKDNNDKIAAADLRRMSERNSSENTARNESGKLRKLFSRMKSQESLQKEFKEFACSSDDGGNGNDSEHRAGSYSADIAQKSRELCARYVPRGRKISRNISLDIYIYNSLKNRYVYINV